MATAVNASVAMRLTAVLRQHGADDRVATRPVDKPGPALVIDQLVLRPVYVFGHQRPVRGKDQEPPGAGVLDQQMTAGKQAKQPGEFGSDLVFLKDILVDCLKQKRPNWDSF